MRIGIFVLMAGREAGGPETYEVQLVRALASIDRANEYVVYCTTPAAIQAIGVVQENVTYRVLGPGPRAVGIAFGLPARLVTDGIDIFHATFTPPPLFTKPLVFTMHCLSNFAHPEFYPKLVAWRLNGLMRIGLARAACVLCVSENVRDAVHHEFAVPRERLAVAYNGVGTQFVHTAPALAQQIVADRFGIDYPYVLFVGKLQARKNIVRLIRAFADFKRATGSDAKLLLAGKRTATSEGIDEAIREQGVSEHVVEAGYFRPTDLPALYSAARMFVFPSLWEGFGIPVAEAMACGTPVITSTVTSLPEVAGGAAVFVDPCDTNDIAAAMARVDRSPALRAELIARGLRRASDFTWTNCARATLEGYARVAAGSGSSRRM
jgi:glycosyltransferase involved in cell wall biosynthesis